MTTGDIVIVSFPFTDLTSFKARPAVVVNVIEDNFKDVVVCLITSIIPAKITALSMFLPADNSNNLKVNSLIKIARIATVEFSKIKAVIGKLNASQLEEFKTKFKSLVEL